MTQHPVDPIRYNTRDFETAVNHELLGQVHGAASGAGIPQTDDSFHLAVRQLGDSRSDLTAAMNRVRDGGGDAGIDWDEQRKELWRGLVETTEALERHPKVEKREAAGRLVALFREYDFERGIHTRSIEVRSSQLERIFGIIDENPEVQADLATAGLSEDWIEPLRDADVKFSKEMEARGDAPVDDKRPPTVRESLRRASIKLKLIASICEAHAEEGEEPYRALHQRIDEIISEIRTKYQAIETRMQNASAAEGAEEGDDVAVSA